MLDPRSREPICENCDSDALSGETRCLECSLQHAADNGDHDRLYSLADTYSVPAATVAQLLADVEQYTRAVRFEMRDAMGRT